MDVRNPRIMFKKLRGHLWMIRKFGFVRWYNYERARRAGATIDYTKAFTSEELDLLKKSNLLPE